MSERPPVMQPEHVRVPALFAAGADAAAHARPPGHYLAGGISELLDLTRAVAAGLVVLVHARLHTIGEISAVQAESGPLAATLVMAVSSWGTMAVIVFFVLSGYLIGGQVLNTPDPGRRFWSRYGINRFSRLTMVTVPAVLFSVAAAYASKGLWGVSYTAKTEGCLPGPRDVIANLLYLQNVVVRPICSDGPIWSIANEAFYYALFPMLFIALRGGTTRTRIAALAGAALLVAYGLHERFAYNGMLAYFGAWMLGAAAAYPFRTGRRGPALAIAVVVLASLSAVSGATPTIWMGYTFAAVTAAGLLLARIRGAPAWSTRPRLRRVAHGLAAFSFSLYLFHMPVMNFARGAFGMPRAQGEVSVATVSLYAAFVALSYAAAYCAWWLFERHTPRLRNLISARVAGHLP
ncbi:MAG TPA: acyltransferase [Longimicrobium sp.]|nr:acyltransferase [Longimicrobium sp.]